MRGLTAPPTAASNFAVSTRRVRLSFRSGPRRTEVLRGVDLDLPAGQLHFLLGPNGCGKSTLLRVIGGLYKPDTGSVLASRPIGFVFQNPDHQVVMPTVAADVAFSLGSQNLPDDEVRRIVAHALKSVGMEEYFDAPLSILSGGQKQRVAIAGALVCKPKLLLLDELTTFVDQEDQEKVVECVRGVVEERPDVTAIWVTHRLDELPFADSAIYMDRGAAVFAGNPVEVRKYVRSLGANI